MVRKENTPNLYVYVEQTMVCNYLVPRQILPRLPESAFAVLFGSKRLRLNATELVKTERLFSAKQKIKFCLHSV